MTSTVSIGPGAGGAAAAASVVSGNLHLPVPVAGYRPLSDAELAVMNRLKAVEAFVVAELEAVARFARGAEGGGEGGFPDPAAARWLALARSDLETGFMYAVKVVARPLAGLGRCDLSGKPV